MHLSVLPLFLAGAAVVTQVTAEPIRIVVQNPSNANTNIHFGHALANANVNGNDDNVARVRPAIITRMTTSTEAESKGVIRRLCWASLREKAIRMSNALRLALGLPLTKMIRIGHTPCEPLHWHRAQPKEAVSDESVGEYNGQPDDEPGEEHRHPHPRPHFPHRHHRHHKHHKHHHKHHYRKGSFANRVHRAVMALGPWGGHGVAFVLGCGIGVLLRMFWVLSVLAYRAIRGEREEAMDHAYIVLQPEGENVYVPQPVYTDAKVKVAEAKAPAEAEVRA